MLPMLNIEAVLPILRILPKLKMLLWLKTLRMLCVLLKLSHPRRPARRAAIGNLRERFKREAAYLPKIFAPFLFLLIIGIILFLVYTSTPGLCKAELGVL